MRLLDLISVFVLHAVLGFELRIELHVVLVSQLCIVLHMVINLSKIECHTVINGVSSRAHE